jgi:hypothetical protein
MHFVTIKTPEQIRTSSPNGEVVGRIYKSNAGTLAFWHHEGRNPTHGYAATREAAMAAFAKSWRRE